MFQIAAKAHCQSLGKIARKPCKKKTARVTFLIGVVAGLTAMGISLVIILHCVLGLLTHDYSIRYNLYWYTVLCYLIGMCIDAFIIVYLRIVQERTEKEVAVKQNVFIEDIRKSYEQCVKGSQSNLQPCVITGTDMTFLYRSYRASVENQLAYNCIP